MFVSAIQFSTIEILHGVIVVIIIMLLYYYYVVIIFIIECHNNTVFFLSQGPEGSFLPDRKPSGTDHW